VGDLVLSHLRKERFQRGTYNNMKMKNIGPCKILRNFEANSYELELADDVAISPIFKIIDMNPYRKDDVGGPKYKQEIQREK
jgi:hypothetical protein